MAPRRLLGAAAPGIRAASLRGLGLPGLWPPASKLGSVSAQPMLRVIHGDATPEEIAAIVSVLAVRARRAAGAAAPARQLSIWADKGRMMREPLAPSQGGWRRSAFPR